MIQRKKKQSKIIRKPKKVKDVYKYLALFSLRGEIQKVLVEKEGKKEAIIVKLSTFGKRAISIKIHKITKFHKLCNTLKESKKLMIKYQMNEIKELKSELIKLKEHIKRTKKLKEGNL